MNCPSCGTDLPEAAKFCGSCGYQMTEPASPSAAPLVASAGSANVMSIEEAAANPPEVGIGELLGESWELTKPNLLLLLGGGIVMFLIMFAAQMTGIGGIILMGPIYGSAAVVGLRIANGAPLEFGNFFDSFKLFLPLMLVGIVSWALTMVGTLLLIIPGLYLALAFSFAYHLVIDRGEDFWPALMGSMKVWNANVGLMLLWALVGIGLFIAGALPCYLGLLVVGPLMVVAQAVLYKKLFGIAGGAENIGQG
jgi:hypothetical protein